MSAAEDNPHEAASRPRLAWLAMNAALLVALWVTAGYVVSVVKSSAAKEPMGSLEGDWIGPVAHYTKVRLAPGGKMELFIAEGRIARKGSWEWSEGTAVLRFSEFRWFEGELQGDRLTGTLYERDHLDGFTDKQPASLRRQ